jgi:hypothetical protein
MGSLPARTQGACIRSASQNGCRVSIIPAWRKHRSLHWERLTGIQWQTPWRHGATVRSESSTRRFAPCLARPRNPQPHARTRRDRFACAAAVLLAAFIPLSDRAILGGQSPTEFQVKAAYLFNFLKFVEWPDDPGSDPHGKWVIGFVGDSPIGNELSQLVEGKNVLGRDLLVKKFQPADNLRACNILFISESEKKRLPSILAELRGSSVLTAADMDNFIGSGGMIQFVVEDARVRVAIDVGATSRAHLKISSKLLSLARSVTGTEQGANN